ncbi:MAG: cell division protein ZapB [Legionellales bacterium]|jgi:chromosome segregation ATPase
MLIENNTSNKTPIEQLEVAYSQATAEICHLRAQQQQLEIKNASLEEEIARLKEQLQLAQQRHFGKKKDISEIPVDPLEGLTVKQTVSSYTRTRKKKSCGRLVDFSGLPRFCIHHDLDAADKICAIHRHGFNFSVN